MMEKYHDELSAFIPNPNWPKSFAFSPRVKVPQCLLSANTGNAPRRPRRGDKKPALVWLFKYTEHFAELTGYGTLRSCLGDRRPSYRILLLDKLRDREDARLFEARRDNLEADWQSILGFARWHAPCREAYQRDEEGRSDPVDVILEGSSVDFIREV